MIIFAMMMNELKSCAQELYLFSESDLKTISLENAIHVDKSYVESGETELLYFLLKMTVIN